MILPSIRSGDVMDSKKLLAKRRGQPCNWSVQARGSPEGGSSSPPGIPVPIVLARFPAFDMDESRAPWRHFLLDSRCLPIKFIIVDAAVSQVAACQSHQNENLPRLGCLKCLSRALLWSALAC
jgi:hypothetical protein